MTVKTTKRKKATYSYSSRNLESKAVSLHVMGKKNIFGLVAVLTLLIFNTSCDSYQKVLRSTDFEYKRKMAKKYYNEGVYYKAIPLFEELMSVFKGTQDVEKIYYFYAYSHYGQDDYLLAAHYFKTFADTYPRSVYAEDAQFMTAFCYYKLSPKPSLEQTYTGRAIEYFQLFANAYPNSDKVKRANQLMEQIRLKLETKAFLSAELYFKVKSYKAAATAFENILEDFPDTRRQENLRFLILKSFFLLAENSIKDKQKERYEAAIDAYFELIDRFPEGANSQEAERMYETSLKKVENLQ